MLLKNGDVKVMEQVPQSTAKELSQMAELGLTTGHLLDWQA
jgi:hypothetical protein